ncbi:sigma factor, partial [Nocardia fluminea]|uniref:sigma factor n=1 Tax=Nocardia fluminea TaxID=134984 RepID=UPI0036707785
MTARRGSAPINLRSVTEPAPACPTVDRRDRAVQEHLSELLDDVAAGDRAAFAEFYRLTSPRVFGLALRVVRNHGAAEDIAQEVFLQVWSRGGGAGPRPPPPEPGAGGWGPPGAGRPAGGRRGAPPPPPPGRR